MTTADLIDRRVLRLCEGSTEGTALTDVLRLFADAEQDDVLARIAALVEAGKLRREGDRLWRAA